MRIEVATRRLAAHEARVAALLDPRDPDVGAVLSSVNRLLAAAIDRLRRAEER